MSRTAKAQPVDKHRLRLTGAEMKVVLLVSAVQFINMLDSMMVLPLGPEFSVALDFPASKVGLIGGSFVLSACVSGLLCSVFLDRVDRRKALAFFVTGLCVGTLLCSFAVDLPSLLAARVLAGAFGGPAGAVALAIIADSVAPERRGRAMGLATSAFAVASVVGVPFGMQLAIWGGWQAPFLVLSLIGFVIAALVYFSLPPMNAHVSVHPEPIGATWRTLGRIAARPDTQLAALMTFCNMAGSAILIPNLATYMAFNLGYPREQLGLLWMAGGVTGLLGGNLFGRLSDRHGPAPVLWVGAILTSATIWLLFDVYRPGWPLMPVFATFVFLNLGRMAVASAVNSHVPPPHERGRFNSLLSVVMSATGAAGAFISAAVLGEAPDGSLVHMDWLSYISITTTLITPFLVALLFRRISRRDALAPRQPATTLAQDA